jgi:hypothetical protein
MKKNIYIREGRVRKKALSFKKLFLFSLPAAVFLLFLTLLVTEGDYFTSNVGYVLGAKNYVQYETYTVSFSENIPESYIKDAIRNLEGLEYDGKRRFEIKERNAEIQLSREQGEDSIVLFSKNLIPVGHIYSLLDEIEQRDLNKYNLFVLNSLNQNFLEEEYEVEVVLLDSMDELVEKLGQDDNNIGLIEFNDLDFRIKILNTEDGHYLEDQNASIGISFYANVSKRVDDFVISVLSRNIDVGSQSWDRNRLVKINMGGVVAITRGLAFKMDNLGDYAYPAREIGSFLADADLTHVSNEVSFMDGCKSYSGLRFCSRPEYIEVLKESGVDIVELTGNHNNDFGSQYSKESIELYQSLGMRYFGGGLNTEDASKILYEEVNGSTVAFIGYNYYDTIYPSLALAGEQRSGANSYSDEKMRLNINEAKEKADVVIVTFQFQECWSYPPTDVIYPVCYKPLSNPDQKGVFRMAVDFGADIVVGTQAHQPQTYELYNQGVIFYGLGNLFFDQLNWIGTRQGLILSHYFYEGRHIQTELTPIYMDMDLMPRLATKEQGDLLLKLLKEARD